MLLVVRLRHRKQGASSDYSSLTEGHALRPGRCHCCDTGSLTRSTREGPKSGLPQYPNKMVLDLKLLDLY